MNMFLGENLSAPSCRLCEWAWQKDQILELTPHKILDCLSMERRERYPMHLHHWSQNWIHNIFTLILHCAFSGGQDFPLLVNHECKMKELSGNSFQFSFLFSNYETYNFKKEQSLFVGFVYGKAGSPIHNSIFTSIYLGRSLVDVLGVLSRSGLCVLLVIFNDDCGDDDDCDEWRWLWWQW